MSGGAFPVWHVVTIIIIHGQQCARTCRHALCNFPGCSFTPLTYEILRLEASPAERKLKPLQRQLNEKQLWRRRLNGSGSGRQTVLVAFWEMDGRGGEKEGKQKRSEERHRRRNWYWGGRRRIKATGKIREGRRGKERRKEERKNVSNASCILNSAFLLQASQRKQRTKLECVQYRH